MAKYSMYATLEVSDEKTVKLRLRSKDIVDLERAIKKNPLSIFMDVENNKLPTITEMVLILHYSLQALEHGYTLEKTYDLYDEYIDNGHSMVDLISVMLEVFQASGIVPDNKEDDVSELAEEEDNEKN